MKKQLRKIYYKLLDNMIKISYYIHYGKRIKKLKNTKRGQRCFIIGNGPSLTISDLEMLKDEDTFAANRIYTLFSKTSWRPTYYCIQDFVLLNQIKEKLNYIVEQSQFCFLASNCSEIYAEEIKRNAKVNMFNLDISSFYPDLPQFSNEVNWSVFEGFTVTYSEIQMAVYMGYSDIYLIGVDHNYNIEKKADGSTAVNETLKNYVDGMPEADFKIFNLPQLDKSTLAYVSARKYCEKNGINIWNATRGGKLETFKRINFDSIKERIIE